MKIWYLIPKTGRDYTNGWRLSTDWLVQFPPKEGEEILIGLKDFRPVSPELIKRTANGEFILYCGIPYWAIREKTEEELKIDEDSRKHAAKRSEEIRKESGLGFCISIPAEFPDEQKILEAGFIPYSDFNWL